MIEVLTHITHGESCHHKNKGPTKSKLLVFNDPLKPSATWFTSLDSCISKFLWKNKPPRISLKTLQKTKDRMTVD